MGSQSHVLSPNWSVRMKLLELVPKLEDYTRIRRKGWKSFLIKPSVNCDPLIKLDLLSIQIGRYELSYGDLLADDWEIIE